MKRLVLGIGAAAMVLAPYAQAEAGSGTDEGTDLLFSEYVEGSGYNKALEIYNGTGEVVDLSGYTVELYSNGSTTASTDLTLEGTLEAGDVHVIAHTSAKEEVLSKADTENGGVTNFNGDDPVVLKKGDTVVDSIGQTGSGESFGEDVTFVRDESITSGDTVVDDAFEASAEWNAYPKDTFENLGRYEVEEEEAVEQVTITEARSVSEGSTVRVEGVVTASFVTGGQTNLYVQDDTAGIILRGPSLDVELGTRVEAQGTLGDYFGMAQIETVDSAIEETGSPGVPQPETVTSSGMTEDVEGELVQAKNVTVESVNESGDYTLQDEEGTLYSTPEEAGLLDVGDTYEQLTGVVNYSYNEYRIVPRNGRDVVTEVFAVQSSEQSGRIVEGTEVELYTAEEDGEIRYTTDGSEADMDSTLYTGPIPVTEDTTLSAVVVKEDGTVSEGKTYTYSVLPSVDDAKIHDIQGVGHTSPYDGQAVTGVTGVVTKLDGSGGFYMQSVSPDEDIRTSEGIYVYSSGHEVEVGDEVAVDGEVAEWREDGYSDADDLLTTQISASGITEIASGSELPDTTVIGEDRVQPTENIEDDGMTSFDPKTDALDFYESLEGMLVELPDATVTGPVKYEELPVYVETSEDQAFTDVDGLRRTEDDLNPERMFIDVEGKDVTAKTGDYFEDPITGVVNYDYSNYKIRPTGDFPELKDGGAGEEFGTLEGSETGLSVATYNMENFSPETSPEKTARIAEQMVENMNAPDIVGLVEVQDNSGNTDDGTVDGSESYKTLITAIEEAGGPAYEYAEVAPQDAQDGGIPGGNIRVGVIYNPERVTMTDKPAGDATTAVQVTEDGLSHNPARIDPENEAWDDSRKPLAAEFEFNKEKVIVVTNHFNSKGGDGAPFGGKHPYELGSEKQRMKQATVIRDFTEKAEEAMEEAKVVVMGDLNDFEFSAPLEHLEGGALNNLTEDVDPQERYTYNYQGNAQALDHILATDHLYENAEIETIHVNSNFSTEDGRASDHDPVQALFEFGNDSGQAGKMKGHDKWESHPVHDEHPGKGKNKKKDKWEDHPVHDEHPGAGNAKNAYELAIMHTNDTHGSIGNIAETKTAIDSFREDHPKSLLLSGGDVFSGTLYFREFLGMADLDFMNQLEYDAMTFGNHEFDLGSGDNGHEALLEFVDNAEFPFVASNVDFSQDPLFNEVDRTDVVTADAEDGQIYSGFTKKVKGEDIGIFGLTTEETADISSPEAVTFSDYMEEAEAMVEAFDDRGVDKIIALTHLGFDDNPEYDNDRKLAEQVDGIDIIVGGHTHTEITEPRVVQGDEPTVIVQAGGNNDNLGTLEVEFDKEGVITDYQGELVELEGLPQDESFAEQLKPYTEKVQELQEKEIGVSAEVMLNGVREDVRTKETNLGNLITDGMLWKAQQINPETQISVSNGGGIRTSIDEGPITLGEVLEVMPFGNELGIMEIQGAEFMEALEHSVSTAPTPGGQFLHVSGMKFEYDSSQPVGDRIVSAEVLQEDGTYEPLKAQEMYYVASNLFTIRGGDDYDMFAEVYEDNRVSEPGFVDYDVFTEYLKSQGESVAPEVEGRIIDVNQQ
ncbi:5'-nucleotidase C-terminal domain-containing protein [Salimicrobium sp. PL1-032A]|uniref:5'-nucleotidase C-terminal domain-containing protein n=1 Tax=Salimicrobium sp. PL1-032A TaxID=3095364 RepID=UPI00326057F7